MTPETPYGVFLEGLERSREIEAQQRAQELEALRRSRRTRRYAPPQPRKP